MNEEKKTNEELDTMMDDLDSVIDKIDVVKSTPRVDLEDRSRRETARVSFEDLTTQREEDAVAQAPVQVLASEDDDVRIFDSSANMKVITQDETRVIDEEDVPKKRRVQATRDDEEDEEENEDDRPRRKKKKYGEVFGCLKSILYVVFVLVVAAVLAWYAYRAVVDVTGIGRDSSPVDVVIEEGDTTEIIAQKLKDHGVIQEPLFFRVYCRFVGADASFHPGTHTVSANDGYDGIVDTLQNTELRASVTVMIPEGATLDEIADLLEENNVCTSKDFYDTVTTGSFEDYDFIAELTAEERANRVYLLEGYLFPDTYEFLQECSADTVVRKMLDNFSVRVNADTRAAIKASGKTLNEVLIAASIIEKEAGFAEDMPRVMRVIQNRLDNPSSFPRLEMDSTISYIESVNSTMGETALNAVYNTYEMHGLPVGSICNPGLDAINAAMNPSEEADIINCFYFASIVETGETEFFETFDEHEAWCIANGVGMYG